jgi:hypothetical protein
MASWRGRAENRYRGIRGRRNRQPDRQADSKTAGKSQPDGVLPNEWSPANGPGDLSLDPLAPSLGFWAGLQ